MVIERLAVASVLGSIPASSDTGESEGQQMSSVEELTIKIKKNSPFKLKIISVSLCFDFFASFCLFLVRVRFRFFLG